MFHGLVEVKGREREADGRSVSARVSGSVCERSRACVDVFVCGMAGIRVAASRQGTWQPLPADAAAGLLHGTG